MTTSSGERSTATGYNSEASGTYSSALGTGSTASGQSSVALGYHSDDGGQDNVVSVGSAGNERRIINVTAGINNTDAVNVGQMNTTAANTLSSANAYTDTSSANTLTSANAYTDSRINERIGDLDKKSQQSIAGSIAMARATIPLNPGESGIAMGFGNSNGENALAVSFQHYTKHNVHINIGSSLAGGRIQAGAGIGLKF